MAKINAIETELVKAITEQLDAAFVTRITSGVSVSTSNGGTRTGVLADLYTLLAGLTLQANSKVFILTSSDIAKHMAVQTTPQGELAFPEMTPMGGTIAGIQVIPTSGVSSQLIAVDASQLLDRKRVVQGKSASREQGVD